MTATAPPPMPDGDEGSGSLPSVLRTKRTIALLRICVLAVVTVLYLSSVGVRRVAGPGALLLLIGAFVYALVCLVLSTRGEESSVWGRVVTLAIDVALITAWIDATGGGRSEFWTLFLIVIVAVALRFGIIETVAVAVGLAVLLMVLLVENGVLWTSRLYRPTLLLVAGFAIGVLSLQRADQRQKRFEMEAIAESRARQLGRERAEVERLRRVDLARTEFVGVAAHELRTPLAAILGRPEHAQATRRGPGGRDAGRADRRRRDAGRATHAGWWRTCSRSRGSRTGSFACRWSRSTPAT